MYWKVSTKGFSLAYYAQADNRETAVKKVERLAGMLSKTELQVKQIGADAIPEGETIL